jgi:hypothetical protein
VSLEGKLFQKYQDPPTITRETPMFSESTRYPPLTGKSRIIQRQSGLFFRHTKEVFQVEVKVETTENMGRLGIMCETHTEWRDATQAEQDGIKELTGQSA